MNNRLGDLLDWANEPDNDEENDNGPDLSTDIEKGAPPTRKVKKEIIDKEIFFTAVEQIKADIGHIIQATADVECINKHAQKATTTEREKQLSQKLQKTIDTTNKKAMAAKNLLGELKVENERLKEKGEIKNCDLRIRETLLMPLTRKFVDEMKSYRTAQQRYKTDIQNKMSRQVKVVMPDASDKEVEEIMRSEGGISAFIKESIMTGGINEDITTITAKVAGKYQDMKALEQSVAELHQMFLDLSFLVEQQGELLCNIEYHVRQAVDVIQDANEDIYVASETQKSIRKKQLWLAFLVVIVFVIILASLRIFMF